MSGTFKFKMITHERVVLETEVEQVSLTARDGQLSILPHHEPLVTAIGVDVLRYKEKGEEHSAAVIGGILEVGEARAGQIGKEKQIEVTVLSDAAELGIEIDEARANQARFRAEAEKSQKVDKLDTQLAEMALTRAIARLKAVEIARERQRLRR